MRNSTNTAHTIAVASNALPTPGTQVAHSVCATHVAQEDSTQSLMLNGADEKSQFELARRHFKRYAAFACPAPQPERLAVECEPLANAYFTNQAGGEFAKAASNRIRQTAALHAQLSLDAPDYATHLYKTPTDEQHAGLVSSALGRLRAAVQAERDVLIKRQEIMHTRIQRLVVVARSLFEAMSLGAPADGFAKELAPGCLSLMEKTGIDIPARLDPVELYKAVSRCLLVSEDEYIDMAMELLADELCLVRMDFYAEAGRFLKSQA